MSVKENWINEFIYLLNVCDPKIDTLNEYYSYQLATAYFDWNSEGTGPEDSVEEAFQRYKSGQE